MLGRIVAKGVRARMNVVLGIDGGGTRRAPRLRDGERVLAHGESGSIKRLRVGAEAAEENLRALLKDVYAQAGVNGVHRGMLRRGQLQHAGNRGVDHRRCLGVWRRALEVVGDEVIALDAAFQGGPGILQIAGTGSNTIGRAPDGSREMCRRL